MTISIQFYWNYKNYEQNKQRVLNEIQISLDNSIEAYYINLSKKNHFAIIEPKRLTASNKLKKEKIFENIFKKSGIKGGKKNSEKSSSFKITSIEINSDENDFKRMDSSFIKSIFNKDDERLPSKNKDSIKLSNSVFLHSKNEKKNNEV